MTRTVNGTGHDLDDLNFRAGREAKMPRLGGRKVVQDRRCPRARRRLPSAAEPISFSHSTSARAAPCSASDLPVTAFDRAFAPVATAPSANISAIDQYEPQREPRSAARTLAPRLRGAIRVPNVAREPGQSASCVRSRLELEQCAA